MEKNTVQFVEMSHHDLGWHKGSYRKEADFADKEIDRALLLMRRDKRFCWTHEYAVYIKQYLEDYPEKYDELYKRIREGRFCIGAGYTSPYTSFVAQEILIRQFILGKMTMEKLFPDLKCAVFFNTDVPSLTAQFPQILRKSDVEYLYLSRSWNFDNYKSNEYLRYVSPDGTKIKTHFMHQYGNNVWYPKTMGYFSRFCLNNNYKMPLLLNSTDCKKPLDFRLQMGIWNKVKGLFKKRRPAVMPEGEPLEVKYDTYQNAVEQVFDNNEFTGVLRGEWPNKWVYENSGSDYNAFWHEREAERYARSSEIVSCSLAVGLADNSVYDAKRLETLWSDVCFSCHGYAPQKCIEDFRERYRAVYDEAKKACAEAMESLACRCGAKLGQVVVFNTLNGKRNGPISVDSDTTLCATDLLGNRLPTQHVGNKTLVWVTDVPSLGYKTINIEKGEETERPLVTEQNYENRYYRVSFGKGATFAVFDKDTKTELFDNKKFTPFELIEFDYLGKGAGEQHFMQQPNGESYVRLTKQSDAEYSCISNGEVATIFEAKVKTTACTAVYAITIFNLIKKIEFRLKLEDLSLPAQKQIRLMLPINMSENASVFYEVPFFEVEVGKDEVLKKFAAFNPNKGNFSDEKHCDNEAIRPREVQNWIRTEENGRHTVIGSYNLAWDYQDPTAAPIKSPVLQAVLVSSAEACHSKLDYWKQSGNREYVFTVASGVVSVAETEATVASNNPLLYSLGKGGTAELPAEASLLEIKDGHTRISAVKMAEDGKAVVAHFYSDKTARRRVSLVSDCFCEAKPCNLLEKETGEAADFKDMSAELELRSSEISAVRLTR